MTCFCATLIFQSVSMTCIHNKFTRVYCLSTSVSLAMTCIQNKFINVYCLSISVSLAMTCIDKKYIPTCPGSTTVKHASLTACKNDCIQSSSCKTIDYYPSNDNCEKCGLAHNKVRISTSGLDGIYCYKGNQILFYLTATSKFSDNVVVGIQTVCLRQRN